MVLIRHGESLWNQNNIYTGWSDPDLTEKGILECSKAAEILKSHDIEFTGGYCSSLKRSINSYNLILEELYKSKGMTLHLIRTKSLNFFEF